MINKILIKNFRSIKKVQINNISNSLGLIGENSSGKSSILAAILAFLGEYSIKNSDFRFDKNGNRENEIVIGLGIDFDDFVVNRILYDMELNQNKPLWYSNALDRSKGQRSRNIESKSYIKDLRQNIKKELSIGKNVASFYFKIKYFREDNDVRKEIYLTTSDFRKNIQVIQNEEELIQIKNIIQPRYAYLHDERNFNEEGLGKIDSTTNKLFSLLLPSMNIKKDLENKSIEEIPISRLSIPQINQFLLKKIQNEASNVIEQLNKNFKESYNDDVEIEWQFSNQLFENINIKTNFKFSNIKTTIDFQSVGSGTRSMYKIVLLQTLLEMQKEESEPVLFLLEEPELYLYPKLEKQMSKFICEIAKENQVFVTTHSHMSIVSFRKGSLYKIHRENETKNALPVTKIYAISSSLEAMKLLGYDISYLLGKDYLIFVEGKDDQEAYEYLVNKIFGDKCSLKFIIMTGVSKLQMAVNCSVLKYINTNAKSVFIIDSDGRQHKDIINNLIEHDNELDYNDFNDKIILTEYCMLECYTFEKELLMNDMSYEDFINKKLEFIETNKEDINNVLEKRNKKKLDDVEIQNLNVDEKFNYIRKYGFTKNIIKNFRRIIGGSGFKKVNNLNEEELKKCCSTLVTDLKKIFSE